MFFHLTRRRWLLVVALALCGVAAAFWTQHPTPQRTLGTFTLSDANQQPFTRERFAGHWTFLVFGYTHCPDVCPFTLAELAKVYQLLRQRPDTANAVQIVFVSVDPARDTPDELKSFTQFFDRDIIAATGPIAELDRLTDSLGAYSRRLTDEGADYHVEHSADVWLIDPTLRLQARFGVPIAADRVAADFLQRVTDGAASL